MQFSLVFLIDPLDSNLAENTKKHGFFRERKIQDAKCPLLKHLIWEFGQNILVRLKGGRLEPPPLRLSAIIRAVGESGVLRRLGDTVEAVVHGPGDEPPPDNNVGLLNPKRMHLEAVDSWS